MATPAIEAPYNGPLDKDKGPYSMSYGNRSYLYNNSVYWYNRTFTLENTKAAVIQLKLNKSMYHTRIFLNGKLAGESLYSFTPIVVDIKPFLKEAGQANKLVIAVGSRNNLPEGVCHGDDFEKVLFPPGIYDDVKIIMSGFPFITNVQTVPDIQAKQLRVVAEIDNDQKEKTYNLTYIVRELASNKIIATGTAAQAQQAKVDFKVPLPGCKLWSPEEPFLYTIELNTGADKLVTRFGMRSFSSGKEKGVVLLNNKPYFMRGTNVAIFRFFEDSERGDLPWNGQWVINLNKKFKEMHWNSMRYTLGFPPERWYDVVDSLGLLIQDEYPIWKQAKPKLISYNSNQLANEYKAWMRERWNHPSVVIWDGQNESVYDTVALAINKVRALDLSNRPWDNGWSPPASPTDVMESHPYRFFSVFNTIEFKPAEEAKKPEFKEQNLLSLLEKPMTPDNSWVSHSKAADRNELKYPNIINEYGWFWLNRDGSPTTLSVGIFNTLYPEANTPEKRFELYAKVIAMKTEYWRAHRRAAGVLHFCDLGYSRTKDPHGQTSDNWIDVKNLVLEPHYYAYMKAASSPVGIMVNLFKNKLPAAASQQVPLILINDTYKSWMGNIKVSLLKEGKIVANKAIPASIQPLGKVDYSTVLQLPKEKGNYKLVAEISYNQESVKSIREFVIE